MKGKRVFTEGEVTALLNDADPREKVLLLTGLIYCTRIGETLALTFGDFTGKYVEIEAEKGGDTEAYPVTDQMRGALDALQAYYADHGIAVRDSTPLLVSRKGAQQSITTRQAIRILQDMCNRLGIQERVGTHSLRKTALTRIYNASNHNLAVTRRYSRHKSLAMLQYYLGTTDELDLVHELVWA